MRLSELRSLILELDRAYESGPGAAEGAEERGWPGFWSGRDRRVERPIERYGSGLGCAAHGGEAHAIATDDLTHLLSVEAGQWAQRSESEPRLREMLGIERLDFSDDHARIGAVAYWDEHDEAHVLLAASGDTVVPTRAGRALWTNDFSERARLYLGEQAGEQKPFSLLSAEGPHAQPMSFESVREGYRQLLVREGRSADEAALARLGHEPTPKLLSTLAAESERGRVVRVPYALTEAWLFRDRIEPSLGEVAQAHEASRFALGAWLCGRDELAAKRSAAAREASARSAADFLDFLRSRKPPAQRKAPPKAATSPATAATGPATAATSPATAATGPATAATGPATAASSATASARTETSAVRPETSAVRTETSAARPETSAARPSAAPAEDHEELRRLDQRRRAFDDDLVDSNRRGGRTEKAGSPHERARRELVQVRIESTSFSCEHVQVARLSGREAISKPYRFELLLVVTEPGRLDLGELVGAELDIVFEVSDRELRRVHGMIAAADDELESEPAYRTFRIVVVPRAHRLALVETQEIFLEQTVPDVIRAKLARVDLGDVDMRLLGTYAKREYITQYRETDLAFVSRLAEHLGISFFFEERDGLDRIVFTDHASGFQPVAGEASLPFVRRGETQSVHRLKAHRNVMPGLWAHQDYNYRIPRVDLTVTHEVPDAYGGGVIEYGAHYKTVAEGQTLARIRAEERQALCDHYEGASDVCWLSAGGRFTLTDHPRLDGDQDLLVVEVEHEIAQVTQTHGGDGVKRYENRFRAVPGGRTYRPPRVTPRPRIHGLLTARVEPREDQSIGHVAEIDEHGRYTIRFYFDTSPFGDRPKSSHRVRLIQHHAGPDYGTHLPLKAGVEVLVAFVDGDPDRPLIVGAVPNPVTPSPVNSFDAKMHRIKTASGILIEMKDHFKR